MGTTPTAMRIEIAPRSMALVLAMLVVIWIAWQLWVLALILVVALILAGTFNPVVELMERRGLGRSAALVVLFVALVLIAGGMAVLTVPSLFAQLTEMMQDAPASRARLVALLSERSLTMPLAHLVENPGIAKSIANIEGYLVSYSSQVVRVAGYGTTAVVLAFYLLADGKRAQGVVYALVPRDYHMRLARILQNLETIVGGYMRGQLITSVACGAFTFALLGLLGVPNALSLSLLAAVLDVIPFVGGLILIVPAVLVALPLGIPTAVTVLGALSLYTEFESRVLVPRVYGKLLRLSPTAVIVSLVAGGLLMGVLGALLALPIAAGLIMMVRELRIDLPGDDSDDARTNARNARTEAKYEAMSAGSTAPDSGEIAKGLAADARVSEARAAETLAEDAVAQTKRTAKSGT